MSMRGMRPTDLWKFAPCNVDPLTETYSYSFYIEYMRKWPRLCRVMEGPWGDIEGYILGKVEDSPYPPPNPPYDPDTNTDDRYLPWHAHITAVTVAQSCRRIGHATRLVRELERAADLENAWFVDLFVRTDNEVAIAFYKKLGYSVFRRIPGYYNDKDDAFDMRKPLKRDEDRKHVREDGENRIVSPSDVW